MPVDYRTGGATHPTLTGGQHTRGARARARASAACNKRYDLLMAADGPEPVSQPTRDGIRGVERALARAQELVDRTPMSQGDLAWYIEATQVGDLSVLALLLRRERELGAANAPTAHRA